jgi:hypothetical protein
LEIIMSLSQDPAASGASFDAQSATTSDTFLTSSSASAYGLAPASTSIVGADLVGLAVDVTSDHLLLGQTEVTFTLQNQGNEDILTSFAVDLVYSDDPVIGNDDDILVGSATVNGLAAGSLLTQTLSLELPVDILNARAQADDAPGQGSGYVSSSIDWVGLVIDAANVIAEADETNNASSIKGQGVDDVTYFPWDVDSSGQVTPSDAIFVINRLGQATTPENALADFDGSGQITPSDAISGINRLGYGINPTVTTPEIHLSLLNDTGLSPTDAFTTDPTVQGLIADVGHISALKAGFNDTAIADYLDITDELLPDGRFQLGPAQLATILGEDLPFGRQTLHLQALDGDGQVLTEQAFTFNLSRFLEVIPGEGLTLNLRDFIPNSEGASFTLESSRPLPTGKLKADGTLALSPTPDQLGTFEFSIVATTDSTTTYHPITLEVVPDPIQTTRISGQVLDIDGQPLANIPIELGRLQTITDADGNFTFELPDSSIPTESINIDIPQGDVFFDPFNTGEAEIRLRRTNFDGTTGTSEGNPLRHPNLVTSFMDASMVYGSNESRANALRTNDGTGRLKVSDGDLLPFNNPDFFPEGTLANANNSQREPSELFATGDVRANENIGLASLHTVLVREHNRLADDIRLANPGFSGDEVYNRARKLVAAQVQQITYQEYLPLLIGEDAIPTYSGYDSSVDPHISHLFSAAAFRMGHTQAFSEFLLVDESGQTTALSARETSFNPAIIAQNGLDPILRGLFAQQSQAIDTKVIDELRNFLFGPPGSGGIDLAAVDIQRGRDLGLPDYNQTRIDFGLAPVTSFAEITADPDLQAALQAVYGDVNDIDVIVGAWRKITPLAQSSENCFRRLLPTSLFALGMGIASGMKMASSPMQN